MTAATRRTAGLRATAAALLLIAACTRKPPPAPVRPPAALRCPPTVLWPAQGRHPQGLRVQNRSERPVVVWADRCLGWTWMGEVAAQGERLFRLPAGMVAYAGGLRFHVLPDNRLEGHFAALVPIDTVTVLRLTVPAAGGVTCTDELYVNGERFAGTLRQIAAEQIASMVMEYVPAEGGGQRTCPRIHVTLRD